MDIQTARDNVIEARHVLDDVRFNARTPEGLVSEVDWSRLGAASDELWTALAALVDDPAPAPPPPVTRIVQPGQTAVFRTSAGQPVTVRCPNRTTPCAIALTINGGALQSDDPVPQIVDADLVGMGFVEVEAQYDYSSMARAYASVLAALQWVYANAVAIGGDPARVHGVGHSTGASLVALLQLRTDSPGFNGAAFLWSTAAAATGPHNPGPESIMIQTKYGRPPDVWYPINWIRQAQIDGKNVEVYQVHATDDPLVSYVEAEAFAQAGINTFKPDWHYHRTTGGHGATAAPQCAQSQADLQSVDRS